MNLQSGCGGEVGFERIVAEEEDGVESGVVNDGSVNFVAGLIADDPGAGRAGLERAPTGPYVSFTIGHRDDRGLAVDANDYGRDGQH